MKKFIVFALFCVSFLIIGCGDGSSKQKEANETGDTDIDAPENESDDEQKPEGDVNDGTSDQETDDTEHESEPEPGTPKTCSEIFTCYISCRSENCLKSCLDKGADEESGKFTEMYDCWLEKCGNTVLDDDFVSCAEENCKEKTDSCEVSLKPEDAVKRFPKPYGKVKVNVASSYIIGNNDSDAPQEAFKGTDFAQGYIGSVTTEPDYDYSTITGYYTSFFESEDGNFLVTTQYHSDSCETKGTAVLFLPENVEKGKVKIGLDDDSEGKLLFTVLSDTGEILCYEGFGTGELDIKAVNPVPGAEGKLAASGNLDILTPYNEPEKFDKFMSVLGKPLCAPKYPKFAGRLMYESSVASLDDGELDSTSAITDAEKYFAFEGAGIVPLEGESEGSLSVDLLELEGIGYALDYSNSAEYFKMMAETPEHPEGERAILLSVGGTSLSVSVTLLLSDIQKMNGKPLKKAPPTEVYDVKWSYEVVEYYGQYFPEYAKACLVAANKVENGVRVGEFQTSHYSNHDFDSTSTVATLSVAMSAELVDGEDLLALYPEVSTLEDLCFCSDTMTSEDVECDSVSGWRDSY